MLCKAFSASNAIVAMRSTCYGISIMLTVKEKATESMHSLLMKGAASNDQEVGASVVMNVSSGANLEEFANLDDGLALPA